ncbi:protein N-lysine methyltransferase METTL21A [Ananas comosus]|uniref:Protein N-lysine methyltransferase METTL21A n=1 Tax=Ananas comosus TaxID=4615 RepID=A0A6P5FF94_ANACO|nr:protein N-lysine methyltransferase METTL21A [Ananas comosus]
MAGSDSDSDSDGDMALLSTLLEEDTGSQGNPTGDGDGVGDGGAVESHHLRSIDAAIVVRQLPSRGLSFQVGLAAAAALRARVVLTDLPHVLPNLHFNARANAPLLASRGAAAVRQLRWGERDDLLPLAASEGPFDAVLGSDVVYYDHLFDPLLETLGHLVRGEVAFVMAHLRRWKKRDAVFFRKAKKVFDVAVLHTAPPLPGSRVGVAVYRFTEKRRRR